MLILFFRSHTFILKTSSLSFNGTDGIVKVKTESESEVKYIRNVETLEVEKCSVKRETDCTKIFRLRHSVCLEISTHTKV